VTFSTYLDFQPSDSEEGVSEYGAEVEELSRRLDPWRFEPELVGFERYFVDPGDSGLTTPPVTVRPVTLYHCTVADCAVMRPPTRPGESMPMLAIVIPVLVRVPAAQKGTP
jgi:hypothetical protein